tara:strand:- start:253 stop:573 length:321 start_codon:yes stop_codon:yes gene_type:complete
MLKKYIIVQTHTNKRVVLDRIAERLIDDRLVACVNIYPNEYSLYKYNDKIVRDREYLFHAKSVDCKFDKIAKVIQELHNYETPEIISLEISQGNEMYLKWIKDEVS